MTGLDNIVAMIIKSAKDEMDSQVLEANQKADEIISKAQTLANSQKSDGEKISIDKAEDIINRGKSTASLETRKTMLFAKQAVIKDVINEAKAKLENLEGAEYFAVLEKLFDKFSTGNEGVMYLSSSDLAKVPADFKEKVGGKITISDEAKNIKNGFILTYGDVDVNCTFDAIFDDAKEELQDKVNTMLFTS